MESLGGRSQHALLLYYSHILISLSLFLLWGLIPKRFPRGRGTGGKERKVKGHENVFPNIDCVLSNSDLVK